MDKHDWIWVAIKIFGIFLIILAITSIPEFIANAIQSAFSGFGFATPPLIDKPDSESCRNLMDKMIQQSISSFISSGLRIILFSAIGVYLLRSGKIIFKIISRNLTEE
jgi:hypothetical protein